MSSRGGRKLGKKWGRRPLKRDAQNSARWGKTARGRPSGRPCRPHGRGSPKAEKQGKQGRPQAASRVGRPWPGWAGHDGRPAAREAPATRPARPGSPFPFFSFFLSFLFLPRKRSTPEMQYLPHTNSVFDNLGLVEIVTTSTTRLCRKTS